MTALEAIRTAEDLGINLWSEGDRLKASPASKIPPELLGVLAERKPEILAILTTAGRDPMVSRNTDKVRFFRGDWRNASPADFNPYRGETS